MAYMDSLAAPEKRRYREKLQVLYNSNDSGVLVDPYSVEDEKWKDDVSLWPPVVECPSNFGDLLTDFNCYVSIVRWLIARPLPPSRERSVQDYPSYPRK